MRVLVYRRPGGGVSVVTPTPQFIDKMGGESQALDHLQRTVIPLGIGQIMRMDAKDLPKREQGNDVLRDAWEMVGNRIVVNPSKIRRRGPSGPAS